MGTYIIGDVQGCFQELEILLQQIHFNPNKDKLWFVGDLVNRGPDSLNVLRRVKSLKAITVLGNHDLHLIAVARGLQKANKEDTLDAVLTAPDRKELVDWLIQQPLLHYDKQHQVVMTHAGIYPGWTIAEAEARACEVESVLQSAQADELLLTMYGNEPACWSASLSSQARWRFIVNTFTRMRYCDTENCLDFEYNGPVGSQPADLTPWFNKIDLSGKVRFVFGHWAALEGNTGIKQIIALDTGCVWGRELTAWCIEEDKRYTVKGEAWKI